MNRTSITEDPNKEKNRIPTLKEERILRELIKKEHQKLAELDLEISELRAEIDGYQVNLQKFESALKRAANLRTCAEQTVSTLGEGRTLHQLALDEEESEPDSSGSESPISATNLELDHIKDSIEISQIGLLKVAESALEEATRKVRDIEKEIDAHKSVIYFINHSLSSSLELRDRIKDRIQRMKEVIGPLRRVPDELWLQIFLQRVTDDEEEYAENRRAGKIPFTTLRLTWICRHWRWIITEHPLLWRYIAIPRALSITEVQWDRIDYCRQRLKDTPSVVYTVRHSRGKDKSGFQLRELLRRFKSFKYLELFVSRRFNNVDYLLASARPHVDELVLRGFPKEGDPVIHCPMRHKGFQHVKVLSCFHAQPTISEDFTDEGSELTTLTFSQADIDQSATIEFLNDMTSITTVIIDMIPPFTINGDPVESATTLRSLTTLNANLIVMNNLFNGNVLLPCLQYVTVRHEPTMSWYDTQAQWASFISRHQRRDTISTLTIDSLPFFESQDEVKEACSAFIGQATAISHLVLRGIAVVPVLESLVTTRNIPPKLTRVTILEDQAVNEDQITEFLRVYYSKMRQRLELQIIDCPSLSNSILQRLEQFDESSSDEDVLNQQDGRE
ncbi:hypothetical protein CPB86DRAFT_759473 [Serendipita vermifera]|nr:hypothetical protein CPB86DRAFT_759473 [Serendipita vermifera]